jgi:hypothetical protein
VDATRVASLAGPASNDTSIQPWQSHHAWSRHSRVEAGHDGDPGQGDRFTSSSQRGSAQDAEDAGLFTVNSVSFFSAAATFFLAQTSPSSASQASTATTSAPSASSNSTASTSAPVTPVVQSATASPATSADSDATPAAATSVTQPTTSTAVSSTPAVSGSTAAPAADSNSQNPLQALNNSLAALGLNQQEIQAFDQIASFIQAISPAAFADLVNGLQALAQQVTQAATAAAPSAQSDNTAATPSSTGSASDSANTGASATAVPAASTGTTSTGTASAAPASNNSAAPAASATPASSGGVQIEELVVQFSEVQVQGTVNSPATGAQGSNMTSGTQGTTSSNSFEFDAFKLQVEEVTLTMPASASQSAQAPTPNQTASASSTSGASQPATTSSTVQAA